MHGDTGGAHPRFDETKPIFLTTLFTAEKKFWRCVENGDLFVHQVLQPPAVNARQTGQLTCFCA
jgi:hypothetical protein